MTRCLLSIALVCALSGCAVFQTRVVSALPSVVSVQSWFGEGRATRTAEDECRKRNRRAVLRRAAWPDYTFYCAD